MAAPFTIAERLYKPNLFPNLCARRNQNSFATQHAGWKFMGIDIETARFLLGRRSEKSSFERCATLGRQHYYVSNRGTRGLLKGFGLSPDDFPNLFPKEYPTYSEPFWQMLGAKTLHTIDASDFEGATHVHDLNQPVPDSWRA